MASPELLLGAYLRLAEISDRRGQMLPRNKFLILAGQIACTEGLLTVAERCRDVVLDNNSAHMLNRFESFADAMRSTEFQVYLKQLTKFCSMERAEYLLESNGVESTAISSENAIEMLDAMRSSV